MRISPEEMSCAQVAGMTTAGLVAMRSSCPRNPGATSKPRKSNKDNYGVEVVKPGPHDVLLGRGGGTNNHSGNINFRKLVNEHKMRYLACSKIEKPNVAREVVELWKKLDPPGRFLSRKEESSKRQQQNGPDQVIWVEVPEKKAREKASQCLRERTPDVVPYIRQLREQQDQMTEQGVTLVQQQLKMQREAEAQKNSLHGMAAAAASYSRRNSLAEHNPYQQSPMAGMNNSSHDSHGEFSSRRGSMPMMQGSNCDMMNTMQQQQKQQSYSRRVSAPHLSSSNHGCGSTPNNAAAMMGQMQYGGLMEPGYVGSDMFDSAYASSMTAMQLQQHHQQQLQLQQLQLQQQQLQHQMQMQQQYSHVNMQQQATHMNMRMPRTNAATYGQQWNMQPAAASLAGATSNLSPHASAQGLNQSSHSHSMRNNNSSNSNRSRLPDAPGSGGADMEPMSLPPAPEKPTSAGFAPKQATQEPAQDQLQESSSSHNSKRSRKDKPQPQKQKQQQQKPKKQSQKPKKKQSPKTRKPTTDKNPQAPARNIPAPAVVTPTGTPEDDSPLPLDPADDGPLLLDPPGDVHAPLPLNLSVEDDDAHGEFTVEEYRKTLESYMVTNNITATNPTAAYFSDDDDLSVESFPDWPDEEEQEPRPKQRGGRAPPRIRGVDRHKSGTSMMSCKTFKSNVTGKSNMTGSNMSGLSGLSMLSDMMSMESRSREDKMSAAKRFSSNASIMSELTDISHTIDGLGLDDDC